MSKSQEANDTDDGADEQSDEYDVEFLTKYESTISHDLGDGLRLTVAGEIENDRPFAATLVDDGSDVTGERFDGDELASETERTRFAERADRLVDADVADEIADRLADLADAHMAGEVAVLDRKTIRVLDATVDVEHRPDMTGSEWQVTFADPETGAASEALLSASLWADNPAGSLDRQLPSSLRTRTFAAVPAEENRDDRWRPVRRIYEMAANAEGE